MSEQHDTPHEPHNPDVRYEQSAVNARAVSGFAAGLAVWLALVLVVIWGMFQFLYNREAHWKRSEFPIAELRRQATTEDQRLPSTGPIIEGFPASDPRHTLGRFGPASAQVKYAADEIGRASCRERGEISIAGVRVA